MNKLYVALLAVSFAAIMIGGISFAQTASVVLEGTVRDSQNDAVVGHATIRVKGIDQVFVTDREGAFKVVLPASEKFVLTVNSIGYEPLEMSLVPKDAENLVLRLHPSDNVLEEVEVSTGYQKLPKERATGSFEVVDEELFNRQIGTDVISRLDGIMPSLLFDKRAGDESNMIMRGVASLGGSGNTGPLIVVDNFPFEGDIRSINPNDVESVSLLKDAAAASIWGARAGNGVLVITTKKGAFNSKWKVSATGNATVTDKPDIFYSQQMTSREFIEVERFLFEQGAFDAILNNRISYPVVTPVVELLDQQREGMISDDELTKQLDILAGYDVRDDLYQYFYRLGLNQQYAVTLSGGGEQISTLFSVGYDANRSTAVGDATSRLNLSLQNSFRPLTGLELNFGMRYAAIQTQNNSQNNLQMGAGRQLYPYANLVDANGNPSIVPRDYRDGYLTDVEGRGHLLDWRYTPYEELSLADNISGSKNMLMNARVGYQFLKGLTAELNYQYEYQPVSSRTHYNERTYFARDLVNRFTHIDNGTITRAVPPGGILDRNDTDLHAHNVRGQASYDRDWNKHNVSAIAGMEIRNTVTNGRVSRLYGYNDDLLTNGVVDFINRHPIYDDISSPSTIVYPNREFSNLQRFVSLYANGAYTYAGKYVLSTSARRDASNVFGASTNGKWTPLWSVGAAWNLSNEPFYSSTFLPVLKIRATYGHSGNVRNDLAAVTTLEYRGLSRLGRFPYTHVVNPPNPLLRWENIRTVNLGVDFGAKNGLLSGSLEFYSRRATDLISTVDSDPTTGFFSLQMNNAVLENKGLDATLRSRARIGQVHWKGDLSLSFNKNTVVRYLREVTRYSQWVGNGVAVSPIEGQSAYPLVSYKWGGLDPENGNPIGYIAGEASDDYAAINQQAALEDLVFHGSALPEYFGAFRNTFEFGNLSLSANVVFRAQYFFRRGTINYSALLSPLAQVDHSDYRNRWQNPGDERYTNVPSAIYPTNSRREDFHRNAETTVERGDHIRLQDISASYSFRQISNNSFFDNLQLTFYARNLGILWRSNGHMLDPDVRQLPLARTWSMGLTATF